MRQVQLRWLPGVWVRLAVPGDGNCFFYGLASSLNYLNYRDRTEAEQVAIGRNLRERILAGREEEWATFLKERGFAEMAPELADVVPCNVYVDDFVLNFVAWLLGIGIVVVTGNERLQFGGVDDHGVVVALAYFDAMKHFESIVHRAPTWSTAQQKLLLQAVENTARVGVGRSPNNARRMANHAVHPCRSGFTGVFPHSFLKEC